MSAGSLIQDILSYLHFSSRVVSKVGNHINVGEKFTLRFTATNTAGPVPANVVYDNPRIWVEGTEYAEPVNGASWHDLPGTKLYKGWSSSVDIEFEAKKDLPWWSDITNAEHVASAYVTAQLDQESFFTMGKGMDIHVEIEET